MEVLGLGKDSVYRRLKGEVSFSLQEIQKLSKILDFSLDEIIGENNKSKVLFEKNNALSLSPKDILISEMELYLSILKKLYAAKYGEMITSLNRLLFVFSIGSEHLFKFFYCKRIHQMDGITSNQPFKDVIIPEDVKALYIKINYYFHLGDNYTFILDKDIYLNTIREIQYYYKRELISREELNQIKDDFHAYIDYVIKLAQSGANELGGKHTFYISTLNIEANNAYLKYDYTEQSIHWINSIDMVITNDHNTCIMDKKWLDSLKKYSILITKSNEMLQNNFFNQQRRYLDNIENELYIIKLY